VIVFSHDPKFDEPAILAALRSDAATSVRSGAGAPPAIAGRGSPRPAPTRSARAPALTVRARHRAAPEEVAISIMAEVIAARSGRVGEPLVSAQGSIRPH